MILWLKKHNIYCALDVWSEGFVFVNNLQRRLRIFRVIIYLWNQELKMHNLIIVLCSPLAFARLETFPCISCSAVMHPADVMNCGFTSRVCIVKSCIILALPCTHKQTSVPHQTCTFLHSLLAHSRHLTKSDNDLS